MALAVNLVAKSQFHLQTRSPVSVASAPCFPPVRRASSSASSSNFVSSSNVRALALVPTAAAAASWLRAHRLARRARKRKQRASFADIKKGLMEQAKKKEKLKQQKVAQRAEVISEVVAEHFRDGKAQGRVVGGAERHGEVLVELSAGHDAGSAEVRPEDEAEADATAAASASSPPRLLCQIHRGQRAPSEDPVVGDYVDLQVEGEEPPWVADVLPRRTALQRRNKTLKQSTIVCANLDLAVIVVSVRPNFSEAMVDRVLIGAHAQGLEAAIVLNKLDLIPEGSDLREDVEARMGHYESIGYTVLRTSAITGEGIPELRQLLSGRTSLLLGNSGVGKSHLLDVLGEGQIKVAIGDISDRLNLGRHTTTTTTLHRLPGDGPAAFLVDSPGARRFSLWDVEADALKEHFVEFSDLAGECRFANCKHMAEPDCAVREAAERGDIPLSRYLSYKTIFETLSAGLEGQWREMPAMQKI